MKGEALDRSYENDIEWMVAAYAEYVYRLAYEFTCNPVDAEDVTYATFMSAQALCGHISECDCVAAVLYGITSSIARERLESNLGADDSHMEMFNVQGTTSTHPALTDPGHEAMQLDVTVVTYASGREFLDVSQDRFRPGMEAARVVLGSMFGHGGYSI